MAKEKLLRIIARRYHQSDWAFLLIRSVEVMIKQLSTIGSAPNSIDFGHDFNLIPFPWTIDCQPLVTRHCLVITSVEESPLLQNKTAGDHKAGVNAGFLGKFLPQDDNA